MQRTVESVNKPIGVIDSLQGGFNLVNRHLWLLILPVLLDLLLWRGPRLSLAPLLARAQDLIFNQPDLPAEFAESAKLASESFQVFGDSFNLLSLLTGAVIGFPSFLSRFDATEAITTTAPVIQIESASTAFLYAMALLLTGLLIGSLWLALIVRSQDGELGNWLAVLRRAGWIWLNATLFLVALFITILAVSAALGIVLTMLALIAGPGALTLVAIMQIFVFMIIIWISIGLSLTISAIALDGVNVARAVWRSLNVVGRNLSSTMGLLLIGLLLTEGFARIWLLVSGSSWGISIGIIGTAYIGAALTAATLLFYQGRYQHWQQIRAAMIQAKKHDQG